MKSDFASISFAQGADGADIQIQEDRLSLCNFVVAIGKVVSDVECFSTRTGNKPKISFRIAIPRTPDLPRKKPASSDFFTVNCCGQRFLPLLDTLSKECQVVVIGWLQSRDVSGPGSRIVHEIGARAVIPILDSLLLSALDSLVANVVKDLTPQARRELLEILANGGQPEIVPQAALDSSGKLHPEIRQALLRVLREESGGD
ncbi:MAG: hypothetical protein ACPL7K_08525 [Armatimonadota bacterium]